MKIDIPDRPHPCYAQPCKATHLPADILMCSRHWSLVPWAKRRAVLDAFRVFKRNPTADTLGPLVEAQRAAAEAIR